DAREGSGVHGKLPALHERRADDFGLDRFAEGEDYVAVLVRVLDDWVLAIIVQTPTGGSDDLAVTVKGFVADADVDDGRGGVSRHGDLHGQFSAQAFVAGGKGDEARGEIGDVHRILGFGFLDFRFGLRTATL